MSRTPSAASSTVQTASAGPSSRREVTADAAPRQVRWASQRAISHPPDGDDNGDEEGWTTTGQGIVLAVTSTRNRLGCAYFDPTTQKISFLEDQLESTSYDLMSLILGQLLPSTVLTPANADSSFVSCLETALSALSFSTLASASASSDCDRPTRLEIRPARDFYAGQGRAALAALAVREGKWYTYVEAQELEAGEASEGFGATDDAAWRNRELRLEAFVSHLETSPLTLGCAGALLGALSRESASRGDLEADRLEVSGLELMRLDKVMQINAEALTSLQIFDAEAHASMQGGHRRGGTSLFDLVNLTRTPLGGVLLREWFVRPSLDLSTIQDRHETVACLLRPENVTAVDAIRSNLRLVKNAPRALTALVHGRGKIKDFQNLWQMLYGSIMVRDAALTLMYTRRVNVVDRLVGAVDDARFRSVGRILNDVIDWERASLEPGRVAVRAGVDEDLDELRRQLDGLPSLLSTIALDLAARLPRDLTPELSFTYYPQLGYLVRTVVNTDAAFLDRCAQHDLTFQLSLQFASEDSTYFKNTQCRDMDQHLGDLQSLVSDKEIEIIQALLDQIAELKESIEATTRVISELDCLLAFAEVAHDHSWTRPEMTEEPVCRIQGGRHPLAELYVSTFIKNDTDLVGGRGVDWSKEEDVEGVEPPSNATEPNEKSMIIVTGANFSGKSVYLKQIALITYLAQIGCFVPADRALIGLTDRILTRVSTRESITRGSSAFMIDLQQISFALRNLTRRSLVIIDEFGKGTESNDGAGLFCGVVDFLVKLGRAAPRTAIASHFQTVFVTGLVSRQLPIHLAHMQILVHDESRPSRSTQSSSRASIGPSTFAKSDDGRGTEFIEAGPVESLTYLYRLAPGLVTRSYAASCAQRFGIEPSVVDRAQFVTDALSRFDVEAVLKTATESQRGGEGPLRQGGRGRGGTGIEKVRAKDGLDELEDMAARFVALDLGDDAWDRREVDIEGLKSAIKAVL